MDIYKIARACRDYRPQQLAEAIQKIEAYPEGNLNKDGKMKKQCLIFFLKMSQYREFGTDKLEQIIKMYS